MIWTYEDMKNIFFDILTIWDICASDISFASLRAHRARPWAPGVPTMRARVGFLERTPRARARRVLSMEWLIASKASFLCWMKKD